LSADTLRQTYNVLYEEDRGVLEPLTLRPDAWTTNRYDDAARLLRTEKPGGRMLDIGCSTGRLCVALADRFDELVGIDLADRVVEAGRRLIRERFPRLEPKIRLITASADDPLPFPDRHFDVVIASAVIEHLLSPFAIMDEIARVTRPGGCVIVTVPNLQYVKHVLDLVRGRLPLTGTDRRDIEHFRRHGWDGHHFHYFTRSSLAALLRHAGFEPEAWTGDGRWARLRRWFQPLVGNLTVRARRRP
jgi:SAM-dependent methyltransferase